MIRVLLVDDDPELRAALSFALGQDGFSVVTAQDGQEALALLDDSFDVVLSDINMPVLDGYALCERIRSSGIHVGIVLLTARDSEIDEALGLDLGADDFITKPVGNRVLMSRLRAVHRRLGARRAGSGTEVTRGLFRLNADEMSIKVSGHDLDVTVSEFRLLQTLMDKPQHVRTRSMLLAILRDDVVVGERLIDTYVARLRKKIKACGGGTPIETVVGAGYRWVAE